MMTYEQYRTARDTARAKTRMLRGPTRRGRQYRADKTIRRSRAPRRQSTRRRQHVGIGPAGDRGHGDKAPFPGYISNRPMAVGEYVSSASIVATILRTNPIKADDPGRRSRCSVDVDRPRRFGAGRCVQGPQICGYGFGGQSRRSTRRRVRPSSRR